MSDIRATSTASSRQTAGCRARPVYADGRRTTKNDIQYSLPRPAWWNLFGWMRRVKYTLMLLKEDEQWLKKQNESE